MTAGDKSGNDVRLPEERPDEGLYIWQRDQHGVGIDVTTIAGPEGDRHYVSVEAFMAVQKERDDYRRVCGLINAWRLTAYMEEPARSQLHRLLASVGFDIGDARAMASIVAEFSPSGNKLVDGRDQKDGGVVADEG